MDKKTMIGAYVPKKVKDILKLYGEKQYPPQRPSTVAAQILVEWALKHGLKN